MPNGAPHVISIIVLDSDGTSHTIDAKPGLTVMEALRAAGLPLKAACGGSLACATCHVIIAEKDFDRVGPPSEDEEDMLDQGFDVSRTSRLACQIKVSSELNGLSIRLPRRS